MYYVNLLLVYSILGHILETVFCAYIGSSFKSGILYGPWTIVYGIGVIIITKIFNIINEKTKFSKVVKAIILFLSVTIILSFVEWIGGVFIEEVFQKVFWDYSDQNLAVGKYISLEMSLIWGGLALVYVYLIKPWMDKVIEKIPYFITCLLTTLLAVDGILTLIFKFR